MHSAKMIPVSARLLNMPLPKFFEQLPARHFRSFFFIFYKHKAKVQESTSKLRKGEPIIQK